MRITDVALEATGTGTRLSARFEWEDVDQPAQNIFFEVGAEGDGAGVMRGEPFLLAGVLSAHRHGERRFSIAAPVCPSVIEGVRTAVGYLNHWYWYKYDLPPGERPVISIEAPLRAPEAPRARAGSFFSGGVDSIFALLRNREVYPAGHPMSITDAIFVNGFDFGYREYRDTEEGFFKYVQAEASDFLNEVGVSLIPVYTNLRSLDRDTEGWQTELQGAAVASVAHALAGRVGRAFIASSSDYESLVPWGSHPLLDPHYSSFDLTIHHANERFTRVEKVATISRSDRALRTLRVCFRGVEGTLNCGKCEKCMRTTLELVCAGALERAVAFPRRTVNAADVRRSLEVDGGSVLYTKSMRRGLRAAGRRDLARAVLWKAIAFHALRPTDIKGMAKWIDRKLLGGAVKRRLRGRGGRARLASSSPVEA